MIARILETKITERLKLSHKAVLLIGPRQTGKTTLLRKLLQNYEAYLFLDGDEPMVRQQLEHAGIELLRRIIGHHRVVFVDEAQRIPNIGLTLKIITDQMPDVQLFVSGSSALELANGMSEPLTGRKWEFHLYPISWAELEQNVGYLTALNQVESRLLYGMYPEVIAAVGYEEHVLKELTSSYLYKDVLSVAGIRRPEIMEKLLKALALQLGQEVSFNELASLVGADKNTVNTYLDLLEKTFVVYKLPPFSRNVRNEISTSRKFYFYDNGIRNALIGNFHPIALRPDKGALWENFLLTERLKYLQYNGIQASRHFWRTKAQQEIDYIEEHNDQLTAYEFKYSPKKNARLPLTFQRAYPKAPFRVISMDNFTDFVNPQNI